jgi:hypothetical protein
LVTIPEAPFPYHLLIFHADGTVHQSNPDAGDRNTSDSALMGAWTTTANGIKAKLVEVTADRTSHKFVSRVEISLRIQVSGDALTGTATAVYLDEEGKRIRDAIAATLRGQRILPDWHAPALLGIRFPAICRPAFNRLPDCSWMTRYTEAISVLCPSMDVRVAFSRTDCGVGVAGIRDLVSQAHRAKFSPSLDAGIAQRPFASRYWEIAKPPLQYFLGLIERQLVSPDSLSQAHWDKVKLEAAFSRVMNGIEI